MLPHPISSTPIANCKHQKPLCQLSWNDDQAVLKILEPAGTLFKTSQTKNVSEGGNLDVDHIWNLLQANVTENRSPPFSLNDLQFNFLKNPSSIPGGSQNGRGFEVENVKKYQIKQISEGGHKKPNSPTAKQADHSNLSQGDDSDRTKYTEGDHKKMNVNDKIKTLGLNSGWKSNIATEKIFPSLPTHQVSTGSIIRGGSCCPSTDQHDVHLEESVMRSFNERLFQTKYEEEKLRRIKILQALEAEKNRYTLDIQEKESCTVFVRGPSQLEGKVVEEVQQSLLEESFLESELLESMVLNNQIQDLQDEGPCKKILETKSRTSWKKQQIILQRSDSTLIHQEKPIPIHQLSIKLAGLLKNFEQVKINIHQQFQQFQEILSEWVSQLIKGFATVINDKEKTILALQMEKTKLEDKLRDWKIAYNKKDITVFQLKQMKPILPKVGDPAETRVGSSSNAWRQLNETEELLKKAIGRHRHRQIGPTQKWQRTQGEQKTVNLDDENQYQNR